MERISTMPGYRLLLEKLQRAAQDTVYSNLYMPADIEKAIDCGKVYFLPQKAGGGIFAVDRGTVYVLYLSVNAVYPLILEAADKPLLTSLVYREGALPTMQAAVEQRFTECGMSLYQQMQEYSLGYLTQEQDEAGRELLSALQGRGYRFARLERTRAAEAHALLQESIGEYHVYSFAEMDWDALCGQDAFQVTDAQGDLCAVTVLPHGFAGGLSVTAPAFRRQGLGKAIKYYGYYVGGKARRHDHIWVADWNTTNANILMSLGARDTQKRARQYVMPARTPAG